MRLDETELLQLRVAAAQAQIAAAADPEVDVIAEFITRMPPQLVQYWVYGEGAAKVRWCTPGAFRRAQRALRKYVPPTMLDGLVANLYHLACGVWPGQDRDD